MEHQKPSVGRVVHYYASREQTAPLAAQIACVYNDTCVNIGFLDSGGVADNATSVCFANEPCDRPRWCWPPRI